MTEERLSRSFCLVSRDREDTLADNFSFAVIYGVALDYQTPALIRTIDAYLRGDGKG